MTEIIAAVAVGLLLLVLSSRAVLRVPGTQVAIVERNGRFHRVAGPGLHVRVPVLDHVRTRLDRREQVISFPAKDYRTADGGTVSVVLSVYCQVRDAEVAAYAVDDWVLAVEKAALDAATDEVGLLTAERARTAGPALGQTVRATLSTTAAHWGVSVNKVESTIEPDEN